MRVKNCPELYFYEKPAAKSLNDFVLSEYDKRHMEDILDEYRKKNVLRENGFEPRKKFFIYGPSGTGKTMFSTVLSSELGLPLFIVKNEKLLQDFDILPEIFHFIQEKPGVYLFENMWIDNDGGILSGPGMEAVFLQLLSKNARDSIIVAESIPNLVHIARQFDDVFAFELPKPDIIRKIIQCQMEKHGKSGVLGQSVIDEAEGLSGSEIGRACHNAIKKSLISEYKFDGQLLSAFLKAEKQRHVECGKKD